MSTIMKALERLEKKKTAENRERPLREEVAERHTLPPPRRRVGRALFIGVGTAVALVSVGGLFAYSGARLETPELPASERSVSTPAVASAPQARIISEERRIAKSKRTSKASTRAAESEPIARASEEPRDESVQPWADEVHVLPPAALVSDVAVVELNAQVEPKVVTPAAPKRTEPPVRSESKRVAPEPKTIARVTPPSVTSPKPTREAAASSRRETHFSEAPEVPESENESPPEVSAAPAPVLRDVRVARTIWHPTPDRRHAYVEVSGLAGPLRVREGDQVGHLSVKKIEPWGVVFLEDGIEIQHRVGASH